MPRADQLLNILDHPSRRLRHSSLNQRISRPSASLQSPDPNGSRYRLRFHASLPCRKGSPCGCTARPTSASLVGGMPWIILIFSPVVFAISFFVDSKAPLLIAIACLVIGFGLLLHFRRKYLCVRVVVVTLLRRSLCPLWQTSFPVFPCSSIVDYCFMSVFVACGKQGYKVSVGSCR